ncbi:SWI4 [Candida oxycetoniae]|uniref:Transcription factor MBP1 n=1 Tax=Candida oxycetoniae TaxID=497107 RepID=A0AAI9WXK6_9ASCO|nr:SWI4 [Candida oxycetoniae]KAI3403865.2 SWI4 [Candida oxycetoniae]
MSGPPPTDVYECDMNESPIMRRCKDDWVNATQILKCCNFPKAKRTKILEKGVQQGLHEKVQGGFGRFQGTWIPLEDARRLAATYGVTKELAPVLFLDFNDPDLVIPMKQKPPPKDSSDVVKRKYTKKAKQPGETPRRYKTGKKAAIQAAEEAAAAAAAASTAPPAPIVVTAAAAAAAAAAQQQQQQPTVTTAVVANHNNSIPPTFNDAAALDGNAYNMTSRQDLHVADAIAANLPQMYNMNQSMPIPIPQTFDQRQNNVPASKVLSRPPDIYPMELGHASIYGHNIQNQPLSMQRFQSAQIKPQTFPQQAYPPVSIQQQIFQHSKPSSSQSSNDTNWSNGYEQRDSDTSVNSTQDDRKSHSQNHQFQPSDLNSSDDNSYASQLLKFFSEDNAEIPHFVIFPPADFNINEPIDDEGHTPLHWAASIGNYEMIHLLLSKGANPLIVNNFGLNPLSKLISFNNCYELRNFGDVLNDLELCLINTDINGRTPLHYLCQFAKVRSKMEGLKFYLKTILNKLTILTNRNQSRQVDLMKNVLNHQDVRGDTCLHIAVKSRCIPIISTLLRYNAQDNFENVNGETARELINSLPQKDKELLYLEMNERSEMDGNTNSPAFWDSMFTKPQDNNTNIDNNNDNNSNNANHASQVSKQQLLFTPVAPRPHKVETPDTERTTVEDDDDVEDEDDVARVDRKHLEALNDDKENIFIAKHYEEIITPVQRTQYGSLHRPLSVITEGGSAEILTMNDSQQAHEQPIAMQQAKTPSKSVPNQFCDSFGRSNRRSKSFRMPNFYKLNEEGSFTQEQKEMRPVPFEDLSLMLAGMIKSYGSAHTEQMRALETELATLEKSLAEKQEENQKSLKHIIRLFQSSGIEEEAGDVKSVEEAHAIVKKCVESCKQRLSEKEAQLTHVLQRNQAYQLANLVQQEEMAILEQQSNDTSQSEEDDDGFVNEEKFDLAIELTRLQIKRNELLCKIAQGTKNYGIDSGMYKYRKLLSLSCGIRVEDIDGLVDGITESLTETTR